MSNKILSVTERQPTPTTLPDGLYIGTWGGYIIQVNYEGKTYELKTEDGVKGMGFKVVVKIDKGVATFEELNN